MAMSSPAQHYVECECGRPSEHFCNTCDIQICENCVTKHIRIKSEKGHEITEYAKRKQKSATCYCELHTDLECRLFCKTCDLAVCYVCVSTKHKQHHAIELNEQTDHIKNMIEDENQNLQRQIRPVYQKALTRISSKILTVPRHFSTVRDKLRSTKASWHKDVDDVMKDFNEDVDEMEKDQMTTLLKQKDIFEERLLAIDKTLKENGDIKNSKNPNILLKFKSNIKQHCNVPSMTDFNLPCFISETVDRKALQRKIGNLETLESFDYSKYEIKIDELKDCVDRLLDLHSATVAIDDTGFPPNERSGRLACLAPLSHDRVWVGGIGRELKLMDLQGRLLDTVTITYRGAHIAFTADGHLIYSDDNDNTIKMISDDNAIQTLLSTGEWEPHGITSTTSGDILVCLNKKDQSLSKVVRYNSAGHVMQEIQYDSNNQPLYDRPWYITVNKNNDICTTNANNDTLVVVDESGTFRFKYDGKQEYTQTVFLTLTTDVDGNIFISDYLNSVIHMLDMDGHFISVIAPQGLEQPSGICLVENGKLCVCEYGTGKVKLVKYLNSKSMYD